MKTMNKMVAIIIVMILATFTSLAGRGDNEGGRGGSRTEQGGRHNGGRQSAPSRVRGSSNDRRVAPAQGQRGGNSRAEAPKPQGRPNSQAGRPHEGAGPARPQAGRPVGHPNNGRPQAGRPHPAGPQYRHPALGHGRPVTYRPARPVSGPGPVRYIGSINRHARPFFVDNRRYYHYEGAFYRYHPGYGYSVVSIPYYSFFPVLPFPCRQVFVGPDLYWEGDGSWFVEADGGYVLVERPREPVYEAPLPPAPPVVPAKPHVSIEFSF